MKEREIKEIFLKTGSSKFNEFHHIYPRILENLINSKSDYEKICIFEIGNRTYETIRAFLMVDERVVVYGLDIGNSANYNKIHRDKLLGDFPGRVHLATDTQGNKEVLSYTGKHAMSSYDGFDLVVDDGSHHNDHWLASFDVLSNYMKPEGVYVIEDIECMYTWESGKDTFIDRSKGFNLRQESYHLGLTLRKFLVEMIDVVNRDFLKRVQMSFDNEGKIPRRINETTGNYSVLGRDDLVTSFRVYTNCVVFYFGYHLSKPKHLGGIDPMERYMVF